MNSHLFKIATLSLASVMLSAPQAGATTPSIFKQEVRTALSCSLQPTNETGGRVLKSIDLMAPLRFKAPPSSAAIGVAIGKANFKKALVIEDYSYFSGGVAPKRMTRAKLVTVESSGFISRVKWTTLNDDGSIDVQLSISSSGEGKLQVKADANSEYTYDYSASCVLIPGSI